MPVVQIYYMPESPPCRAVEMVASMIGVELDKRPINLLAGDHLKEDYIKLNPRHKIPFIVDGELKLGESRAIMMYLVNTYKPDDALYPMEPKKRATIDELLFYEIGTLYQLQVAAFRAKVNFFGTTKELDPEQERAFKESLGYLDQRLASSGAKFMTGDQLTIADISLVATLNYSAAIEYDLSEYENLLAYVARVEQAVPNYGAINDKPLEDFKRIANTRQAEASQSAN